MYEKWIALAVTAVVSTATAIGKKIYDNNYYDEDGYNKKGYDREGYDRKGYNKKGYDRNGYDINSYNRSYYSQKKSEMSVLLNDANNQMKQHRIDFALMQIRIGLEKGIKCVLLHNVAGCSPDDHTLNSNLNMCRKKICFMII
ncbi:MAG: hypothetical protein HDT23_03270 [Ruminococcus sp.]|nr:hypothetical protein [Ruminococcus sp.]